MARALLQLDVPDKIVDLAPFLSSFFKGMITKLEENSHKKPPRECDAREFLSKLFAEMLEAHEQWLVDALDPNMARELNDVANFAFLMYVSLRIEQRDAKKLAARSSPVRPRKQLAKA